MLKHKNLQDVDMGEAIAREKNKHKREKISKQKLECPFCGQAVRTLRPSLLRSARTNRNTFIAVRSKIKSKSSKLQHHIRNLKHILIHTRNYNETRKILFVLKCLNLSLK